jgi:hypothetical protein
MVSGVLGAPGDIESLIRMLPGLSEQTVLPTSEDIEKRLPMRELNQTPTGKVFTTAGQLGGGFYTGPGSPLRAVAALPSAVSRAGRDFAMAAGQPAVNVVKPKGGNWLAGSVERAVEPMRAAPRPGQTTRQLAEMMPANEWIGLSDEAGQVSDYVRSLGGGKTEQLSAPDFAMNRWLETKLGKYMKNEMATPEDPLRLQADAFPAIKAEQLAVKDAQLAKARADMEAARQARGFTPEMMTSSQARIRELERERDFIDAQMGIHADVRPTGYNVTRARGRAGFPEEGMGVSDLAKKWEDRADTFVNELQAFDLTSAYPEAVEANPWLLKVPPETRVYDMLRGADEDLGFAHLTDELRNALNPESGLPRELLLKYSDLDKMSVPQVSKRVDEINAWRSVQKAEADMARAGNAATQVVKEYPEQGTKWVELRQPEITAENLPPGYEMQTFKNNMGGTYYSLRDINDGGVEIGAGMSPELAIKSAAQKIEDPRLEDALKYEGETMGHCVGGYCPDVVEGRSKIFSLRDDKGRPHVTIEVQPWRSSQGESLAEFEARLRSDPMRSEQAVRDIMSSPQYRDSIVQIKGKGNKAPKEDYLPAVQDFVRSGSFGKVGDLGNTGLYRAEEITNFVPESFYATKAEREAAFEKAKAAGKIQDYMTRAEWEDALKSEMPPPTQGPTMEFLEQMANPKGFARGGAVRGYQSGGAARTLPELHQRYAEGGAVTGANFPTDSFDPARIDAIVASLNAEFQA